MTPSRRRTIPMLALLLLLPTLLGRAAADKLDLEPRIFVPLVSRSDYEMRALWLTRFYWTGRYNVGTASKLDEIVAKAAGANFNAILFQVRGTADAFYQPGLEPWSERLNGNGALGQDPGWDPLAHLVTSAHAAGLQVHAYINIYPTWYGDTPPPSDTSPTHPFWTWSYLDAPGDPPNEWAAWRLWDSSGHTGLQENSYLFASPGVPPVEDHIVAVALDIATRYVPLGLDGLHLDYVRYAGSIYSCDPYSEYEVGADCFAPGSNWEDWQRAQITSLVERVNDDKPPGLMLSAAVWPIYEDRWSWGFTEGRNDLYQDSQGWAQAGVIDALMPMIYPANYANDNWPQWRFETLINDYQDHAGSAAIVAGIGGGYSEFSEIADRIELSRQAGTAGHAIFSYHLIDTKDYWDDFVAPGGPHAVPALPPP